MKSDGEMTTFRVSHSGITDVFFDFKENEHEEIRNHAHCLFFSLLKEKDFCTSAVERREILHYLDSLFPRLISFLYVPRHWLKRSSVLKPQKNQATTNPGHAARRKERTDHKKI